jgi:hypothetical protein
MKYLLAALIIKAILQFGLYNIEKAHRFMPMLSACEKRSRVYLTGNFHLKSIRVVQAILVSNI